MSDNYKFFNHKECEFFPCHKTNNPEGKLLLQKR